MRAARSMGWLCLGAVLASACASDVHPPCEGYGEASQSPYVLPWTPGLSFEVYTGNCRDDIPTHSDDRRYAYDFRMSPGTTITAARSGDVIAVVDHHSDDDHAFGHENHVFVAHEDGTFGLYFHLAQGGSRVSVGDAVRLGQGIGVSGTSGAIGPDLVPHLHFEVASSLSPIRSLPSVFRNTRAHPRGLVEGESYLAGPH